MSSELETGGQKMELQTRTDFEDLPVEMRIHLFTFLHRRDLLRARLIGKAFDQVVRLTSFEKLEKTPWTLSDQTARQMLRSHTRHRKILVRDLGRREIRESNVLKYARLICLANGVHESNVPKIFRQLSAVQYFLIETSERRALTATILFLESNDNFKNIQCLDLRLGVTEAESEFMSALTRREGGDRHFPHLQSLFFMWSIDMIRDTAPEEWTPRTYNFIWRTYVSLYKLAWIHRDSLTSIAWALCTVKWLELRIRRDRSGINPAERMEVEDLKSRLDDANWKLKYIDIKVLSWENMNNGWALNNSFLKAQTHLTYLSFKADNLLESEVEAFKVIGQKNKDSLEMVTVSIASRKLRRGSQFRNLDPETFSQCGHLKSLDLKLPTLDPFLLSSLSPGLETLSVHHVFNPWVEAVDPILSRRIVNETLRHMEGRFPHLSKLGFGFCHLPLIFWDGTDLSTRMQEFLTSLPQLDQVHLSLSSWSHETI